MSDPPAPRIVAEGDGYLVVDKPAGLVVHPAPGLKEPTLVDLLADRISGGDPSRPGIVHRLDRDTSGLLVVACDEQAHQLLAAQIQARTVHREYLALVEGRLRSRTGTIDAPLGRDFRAPEKMVIGGRGARHARTHFEVIELLGADSLLAVRLETGRTHQIRVHFQSIGHPVGGDPRYGRGPRYNLTRQFLHARRLGFNEPACNQPVSFSSDPPADLESALIEARRVPGEPGA